MNRKTIENSFKALKEIAERIERSGNPGHHFPPMVARKLRLDIDLHIEILRREFDKVAKASAPAKTARPFCPTP